MRDLAQAVLADLNGGPELLVEGAVGAGNRLARLG